MPHLYVSWRHHHMGPRLLLQSRGEVAMRPPFPEGNLPTFNVEDTVQCLQSKASKIIQGFGCQGFGCSGKWKVARVS